MFKDRINQTPFYDGAYTNDFFCQNILDETYGAYDKSFVSSLRALVYPRLGNDLLIFRYESINKGQLISVTTYMGHECPNTLRLCICSSFSDDERNTFTTFFSDSKWTERYPSWHRVNKVTAFFEKAFNAYCFVNPDEKSTILIADIGNTLWKWHYLQCSIPVILPWYFAGDQSLTPIEVDLLGSLSKKESAGYLDILGKLAEQYDFRGAFLRKKLLGFETLYMRREADELKKRIAGSKDRIDELTRNISQQLLNQREWNLKLIGLETEIARGGDEESAELMNFFMHNDRLVLMECSDRYITFIVKDYLTNFNEDLAETYINNRDNYFYRPERTDMANRIPPEDMEMFLRAVFLDQTLRIRMCAAYQFEIGNCVFAISHYFENNHVSGLDTYIPNPHIEIHACLGGYRNPINEFVRRNDYVGAITQCIASCQSLNIDEYPTMSPFMMWLYTDRDGINTRCIELPDGRVVKMREAIEYLKSVREADNE